VGLTSTAGGELDGINTNEPTTTNPTTIMNDIMIDIITMGFILDLD